MTIEAGKIWATTQYGEETEHQEREIQVQRFPVGVHPARVTAKYGLTINLGNYESARVDVGIELPCFVEEKDAAFTFAWDILHTEIQEQVEGLKMKSKDKGS